jgi:peptidyl-prolyl cis-trans isomerase B (cyclophilin B)
VASTKREKELARQRAERQAARDAAAGQRRRQRNAVLGSVVAVTLVAGAAVAGSVALRDDAPSDAIAAASTTTATPSAAPSSTPTTTAAATPTAEPSASATAAGEPGCVYEKTAEPAAREVLLPPTEGVELTNVYAVTIATNQGDIVFEMNSAEAPCTANNLRSLAHFRYFDGTACHRLTTEGIEVLQCGDPTGTGSGGPGYQFADENLEGATYERGTVAMANAGPGTNGSQFFLVYGDSTLPPNYTPFGKITSGLEVLDAVAAVGSDDSNGTGDGKPTLPIVIETLRAKQVA